MKTVHADFAIERHYDCSPARAYQGFADPELKRQWFENPAGFPDSTWELDFRVGGGEVSGGGKPDGPYMLYRSTFHDIVEGERIVFAYDLLQDDKLISVSLTTVEFFAEEGGTRLLFTEQVAFLDGLEDPGQREYGTGWLLDRLGEALVGEPV